MNKFQTEMFGHFIYDERLTYQDLLDVEAQLIGNTQWVLENQNAEHIDFTPLGDELMVQCAFDDYDEELFHSICQEIHVRLPDSVECRLLFVDKHLASLHIFHINHATWKESQFSVPSVQEALTVPSQKKNAVRKKL